MPRFRTALICFTFLLVTSMAFAGEIDILVQKLVEKGVITQLDAENVLAETKKSVKEQLAKGKLDSVPAWVQNTKWSGNLRLRFETRNVENSAKSKDKWHNRARYSFNYGFETKVNAQTKVGASLSSGTTSSPLSTIETMGAGFGKRLIWLDLVYAQYKPTKKLDLTLTAGRIKKPWWDIGEAMIWHKSLNPEGVAAQYKRSFVAGRAVDTFWNVGIFPLSFGSKTNISPVMYALQGGLSTFILERKVTAAAAMYDFSDIKGAAYNAIFVTTSGAAFRSTISNSTTTGTNTGNFLYGYRVLDFNVKVPLLDLDILGKSKELSLKAEFIKNVFSGVKDDSGYLLGFDLGEAKKPGTWAFGYNYRKILADATIDALNDNFHSLTTGGTNLKGHIYALKYAPFKNTLLTLIYYTSGYTDERKRSGEQLEKWKLDYTLKF